VIAGSFWFRRSTETRLISAEKQAIADSAAAAKITAAHHDIISIIKIPAGQTFTDLLRRSNLDNDTANAITQVVQPVFNLRRLRAGDKLTLIRRWDGPLKSILYRTDWDSELAVKRLPDGFHAAENKLKTNTDITVVQGTIHNSLFESVIDTGEHPELAVRLAEIFAFDLDFYTDPKPGDTFRLVFEKHTVPGDDTPTYGKIFAAEYINGGHVYDAVQFHDSDGHPAYYTSDGKSLQKAFLKSPLKFAARVSSHFSMHRFHPVMKVYRAHLGTDYAVPVGTPVQAIASGKVTYSGFKGGNGNLVVLKHSNGYETYYLHLSQRLVRTGQSVQQGQRLGLSGMTGLASGPHLDFRIKQHGNFVNFERLKLPPSEPVAKSQMVAFVELRNKWMAKLHEAPAATQVATAPAPSRTAASD
jgi:murein DD-endopeptidase MepM/ murein hydrolase activator NlpD